MALQGTQRGRHPPTIAAAANLDLIRQPLAVGGLDCAKRSAVASVPDDALVEILKRLPAKPLCRFKCVSKAWCDLIADRLRCRKLPLTLEGFFYGVETQSGEDSSSYELCSTDEPEYASEDDDCGDYFGSEDGDEFICEDGKDGGSKDEFFCVDGGSKDADEGGSNDKSLSRDVQGHFINVLGRPVPLVDPSFSFLTKQPGIENITLLDSCNGLILFGHTRDVDRCVRPRYIVCNPATEHWVLVPRSSFRSMASEESQDEYSSNDDLWETSVATYLIFDPVVSLHFQLIELCHSAGVAAVHAYSSETEEWCDWSSAQKRWRKGGQWNLLKTMTSMKGSTFLNKMLHLIVSPTRGRPELIAAVDWEGKTYRSICWLEKRGIPVFVGQSKGLLHCISVSGRPDDNSCHMTELSIWVLEDYDAEEWKLKHTVSFSELFGKRTCQFGSEYNVVTIHPDRNLVYFVRHWDYKLISYDMDRKEVCALCAVGPDYGLVAPYVPYFSESPMLSKKLLVEM